MSVEAGAIIDGRYELIAQLGAGAAGVVMRARVIAGGPDVAIKILDAGALASPERYKRFEREARALSGLSHPHVIGVVELGVWEERPFLVMELVLGRSLEDVLARERLTPELALWLGDQLLAGLGHAHQLGVVHRDVKPGNVVIDRDATGRPRARLVDFGLVRFSDPSQWDARSLITAQGAMLGTPAYMSPEHAFGPVVDERSDVYSAGVVLFEMLTGTWPFVAEEIPDVLRAHAMEPVPALSSMRPELAVRPELEALVARAMAKRPEDRFADARAMRQALREIAEPAAWLLPEPRG